MKLTKYFENNKTTLSFEVFPPKTTSGFESVKTATEKIGELNPDFMSVTYGAGGTTDSFTMDIAENLLKKYGVTPLEHLTCVCSTKEKIDKHLKELKIKGIENIMALRGDIPNGMEAQENWCFHHASELISYIKENGDFCVGGACYPEGHPESENQKSDIESLKIKAESGCDFLTTQMFFDNNILYNFLYKVRSAGIEIPVVAGIMPVTQASQLKRIVGISGNAVPPRFHQIVDRFGDNPSAMAQAGVAFATEQVIDLLANGVNNIHIYSMNKPEIAAAIKANLSEVIKK